MRAWILNTIRNSDVIWFVLPYISYNIPWWSKNRIFIKNDPNDSLHGFFRTFLELLKIMQLSIFVSFPLPFSNIKIHTWLSRSEVVKSSTVVTTTTLTFSEQKHNVYFFTECLLHHTAVSNAAGKNDKRHNSKNITESYTVKMAYIVYLRLVHRRSMFSDLEKNHVSLCITHKTTRE